MVLVAFIAAVCVMLVPSTNDAAQAFVVPPPVFALGTAEVAPEVLVVGSTPVGAAVLGVGMLAWLAWDNRDTLEGWGADVWNWLTGDKHQDSATSVGQVYYGTKNRTGTTGASCDMTMQAVGPGTNPNQVKAPFSYKSVNPPTAGAELCVTNTTGPPAYSSVATGMSWQAECQSTASGAYRTTAVNTAASGYTGTLGTGHADNYTQYPNRTTSATSGDPLLIGSDWQVCNSGEKVIRLNWWTNTAGYSADFEPGQWSSGDVAPAFTTVTVQCGTSLADGSPVTVTGTTTTDQSLSIPSCPADHPVRVGYSVTCGTAGMQGQACGGQSVATSKLGPYPQCTAAGATCAMQVAIDGTACTVGNSACWNWKALPNNRLSCLWGPYAVGLGDCEHLAYAYRTGYTTNDPAGWQNDPIAATSAGAADPNAAPSVTAAPSTGYASSPSGSTSGGTSGSAAPSSGSSTFPSSGAQPSTEQAPANGNCWGAMWSWNPIDWVYTPVRCVLTWAFVPPDGDFAAQMATVKNTWTGTDEGRWFDAFGSIIAATTPAGDSSCAGPAWSGVLPAGGGAFTVHPFSACADPEATVAAICKTGLTVLVWLGAAVVCMRLLGSSLGLNLNGVGGGSGGES